MQSSDKTKLLASYSVLNNVVPKLDGWVQQVLTLMRRQICLRALQFSTDKNQKIQTLTPKKHLGLALKPPPPPHSFGSLLNIVCTEIQNSLLKQIKMTLHCFRKSLFFQRMEARRGQQGWALTGWQAKKQDPQVLLSHPV